MLRKFCCFLPSNSVSSGQQNLDLNEIGRFVGPQQSANNTNQSNEARENSSNIVNSIPTINPRSEDYEINATSDRNNYGGVYIGSDHLKYCYI